MRLLVCHVCKSMEELPDFDGPPERDDVLALLASRHESAGVRHNGILIGIAQENWDNGAEREEILARVNEGLSGGDTGLGSAAYALMDTFKDDALKCFDRHLRNKACPDYRSEPKRLTPGTSAERKELGLSPKYDENPALTRYLCDWCPVQSYVSQAVREREGLYG